MRRFLHSCTRVPGVSLSFTRTNALHKYHKQGWPAPAVVSPTTLVAHCHTGQATNRTNAGEPVVGSRHPDGTTPPSPSGSSHYVDVEDQPPSWLFVSPAVAGAYGAQVNLDLDLGSKLASDSLKALEANIKCRGLQADLDGLMENFKTLKKMEEEKAALLEKRDLLLQKFRDLKERAPSEEVEKLTQDSVMQMRTLKAKISSLKSSWDLEEKVVLEALKLPNDLHPSSILEEPKVIKESRPQSDPARVPSHVEIAKKFDLIKFSNVGPKAYFLKGDLVLAEMALTSALCAYLQSHGYRHMSGPEFVKTPIIEGCGGDVRDSDEVLTMVDPHKTAVEPMNHLTGVSLNTFAAYVARTCVGDSMLPLKMFSCGRRYQKSNLPGLLGATQTTQACLFSCMVEEDVDAQFDRNVSIVWDLLTQLGFHARLVQVPAKNLSLVERRKVQAEMFSPSLHQFFPIASVSDVGDFVSRRLMVTHNQNHADIRSASRLHMIHGTALNITSLLALWMENSYTDSKTFSLCKLPQVQNSPENVS